MLPEILIIGWLHRMLLEVTSCTSGRRCFGKHHYHNQICACSELQGALPTCPSEISAIPPYPKDRGLFYVQREVSDPEILMGLVAGICHLVYGMEKRLPAAYVDQA